MRNGSAGPSVQVRVHLPAFLGYIITVAILNWPILLHLNSHVVGRPFDDVFEGLWQIEWMKSALLERHISPLYTPAVFYPHGWTIASSAYPIWYSAVFSILAYGFGAVATYNTIQLGTFVISGFGVYLLVHYLTRNRLAGFLAGCVYISAPVLTLRLGGHLNLLLGAQWLPYAAWLTLAALDAPSSRKRWALLAGFALGLAILGSWYFLFVATVPLMGLFLVAARHQPWRQRLMIGILIGWVCAVVIAPFAYLTLQARAAMFTGDAHFDLADADTYSLSLDRLFVPNPIHALWGRAVRQVFPIRGEQDVVSVGIITAVLALWGILKTPAARARPFMAMAAVSLILAMGTTLHWNGQRVEIPAPAAVEQFYRGLHLSIVPSKGHIPIPLPGLLLYRFVPLYDAMRVWSRFDIPLMLSIAVLAGLGSTYLRQEWRLPDRLILLLGALVLFEGLVAPYADFTPVAANARPRVTQWLRSLPEGTAIIEYPWPVVNKVAMYSQSLHGRSIVNGHLVHTPAFLKAVEARLGVWPNPEAIPILREWHVEYVLVSGTSQEEFQAVLSGIRALAGLCHVGSFDEGFMLFTETHVFRVLQPGEDCGQPQLPFGRGRE
jgi:hypothetical protein